MVGIARAQATPQSLAVLVEQAARSPPSADPSHQQSAAFLGLIRSAAPSPQPEPSLGAMPASPEDMPTPQQSQSPSLDDCAAPASPSMRGSFDGHSLSADGRQDYSAASSPSFGNVPETRQAPAGAARRAASQGLPGAAPLTLAAQDLIMDFGQPANSITSGFFQTARSRCTPPPPSPTPKQRTHTCPQACKQPLQGQFSACLHMCLQGASPFFPSFQGHAVSLLG